MQGKWLLSSQLCSTLNHTVWSGCISSPTGSCAKAYIWPAFKPRLQNMCWRKWFKILRKQSFILESLFTWDNKLLPRIGTIHQEHTTAQRTLAGACLSATAWQRLPFIIHGASEMDKQAARTAPWHRWPHGSTRWHWHRKGMRGRSTSGQGLRHPLLR